MTTATSFYVHSPKSELCCKRRGFNLIEAAIVLGVIGLVIGGIWVAANAVKENNSINEVLKITLMGMRIAAQHDNLLDIQAAGTPTQLEPLMASEGLPGSFSFDSADPFGAPILGPSLQISFFYEAQRGLVLTYAFMNANHSSPVENPRMCIELIKFLSRQSFAPIVQARIRWIRNGSMFADWSPSTPVPSMDTIMANCRTAQVIWARFITP